MLVISRMALPLTSLGQSFEKRVYRFALRAAEIFPIPIQAECTDDDGHFANS